MSATPLTAHRLDVAFVTGAASIENCETSALWRERVNVALSQGHPLASHPRLVWPQIKDEHLSSAIQNQVRKCTTISFAGPPTTTLILKSNEGRLFKILC